MPTFNKSAKSNQKSPDKLEQLFNRMTIADGSDNPVVIFTPKAADLFKNSKLYQED